MIKVIFDRCGMTGGYFSDLDGEKCLIAEADGGEWILLGLNEHPMIIGKSGALLVPWLIRQSCLNGGSGRLRDFQGVGCCVERVGDTVLLGPVQAPMRIGLATAKELETLVDAFACRASFDSVAWEAKASSEAPYSWTASSGFFLNRKRFPPPVEVSIRCRNV